MACSRLQDSGENGSKKKCEKPREDYLRASSSSRSLFSLIYAPLAETLEQANPEM